MFPIYLTGCIVGIIMSYVYYLWKKDVPSEVKIRLQEATIIRLKSDVDSLLKENQKLIQEKERGKEND